MTTRKGQHTLTAMDSPKFPKGLDEVFEEMVKLFSAAREPGGVLQVENDLSWEVMAGDSFVVLRGSRAKSRGVVIEARLTAEQAAGLGKKLARFAKAAGAERD